ncbi:MAG: rhodanese-like domain-containing protein, partial [Longimicrobiales bacterium]
SFSVGKIEVKALHTPGHTPEHLSFLVTDYGGGASDPVGIASGDFVFVGDLGRPDLLETAAGVSGAMEPSARRLFESSKRFLALPDFVQVWPGHGAGSACGKALGAIPQSTVGYERRFNSALAPVSEDDFVNEILSGQPEPPLYFARMKALNKTGVPLLHRLPEPRALTPRELRDAAEQGGPVVVDTRTSRPDFLEDHAHGALFAPLGTDFAMVVGSYANPDDEIYLVVEKGELDEAIRTLVRIGYDRVTGFITPEELLGDQAQNHATTKHIHFADFSLPTDVPRVTLLDVRGAAEFAEGHLPGAINIAHTRLGNHLDRVPEDRPVWVYCRSGRRAALAASLLERVGYDVTHIDGGMEDWPDRSEHEAVSGAA